MGLKLDNRSSIGTYVARTKHVPGAGGYDPDYKKTKNQGPQFTMSARHADGKKLVVPGPGAYEQGCTV